MSNKVGKLFIVSAPSGAGKTSLSLEALKRLKNTVLSISYTTRSPRENEINGVHYHFVSDAKFKHMMECHEFAEWAIVHGHHYGTSKKFITDHAHQGIDVILNIDIQGAKALKKIYPDSISIFIHTPTFEDLKKRLIERKSESKSSLQQRLKDAQEEMEASSAYQFHLVNDQFERAVQELISIIEHNRKAP